MFGLPVFAGSALALLAAVWLAMGLPAHGQTNGVLREVYSSIGGSTLADLTNNAAFPDSPTLDAIESAFEAPHDWSDTYGTRMRALLMPPVTGQYIFWISSDDQSVLFLSSDETPAKKVIVAYVNSWTAWRTWGTEPNQQSAAITLTNGRRYYIEALQKEGGGGDSLSVRWQLPDGTIEEPIPGNRLVPYGLGPPLIVTQPTNVTVVEKSSVAFSVRLARKVGAAFQWQRNGTNMPGETNALLALGQVTLSDSNSTFRCYIVNAFGSTNTSSAVLKVLPDTTRPTLVSVAPLGGNSLLSVVFSEPVEAASASLAANYGLNKGAAVLGAYLDEDGCTVVLRTSPLAEQSYILTVNNVKDRATTPNTILTNAQKSFSLTYVPVDASRITGSAETMGPSSRRTPLTISEIMYRPAPRADGRNLEFVELYNSQEWAEDIGGFRLSGEIDLVFPSNTIIGAKSCLVLAASPADVKAAYGLATVLGYSNALNNASGTIRLRDRSGAVLLEAAYSSDPPYPAAADGAGHSLVLARPSLGEGNPLAWAASEKVGGSPGAKETAVSNLYRTVFINELLAHTDPPDLDYVELFNYSSGNLNLTGCVLTDDPSTNKYRFPTNSVIPGRGFLVLDESRLGFALSSSGEALYLINSNGTRVLDAIRFGGQSKGVAFGRYPDGAPGFRELAARTPGTNNAAAMVRDVILNEIMFDPMSGSADDEYVELYNRGTNSVSLAGWRLRGGISYNFPAASTLPPGGYLVVAHSAARLMSNYPSLNLANTVGDYSGTLGNNGDTIRLLMSEKSVTTNLAGGLVTNEIHVTVDEVAYAAGGRWGPFLDCGSSLERVDPRTDGRLAPAWRPSDETAKSDWVTVQATGVLDNGVGTSINALYLDLLGAGECLVDNVEVLGSWGKNLVENSTFSDGISGWVAQGTHDKSGLDETGGYGDNGRCLHVRASGHGDNGANRIRYNFATNLTAGSTVTLRMKARWLKGWPEILMTLRGNYFEAATNVLTSRKFGTPGQRNSVALEDAPPAIVDVQHSPALPSSGQAVTVTARISDPDGLSAALLKYRVDPATNFTSVSMSYSGAGFYSATIPAQVGGVLVAFYIEARDDHAVRARARFPDDAPNRLCLVRFGEPTPPGNGAMGTYRYWITQATIDRWSAREKLSSDPLDGTFVYNGRVIYNVGGVYSGSPWHAPSWNSPVGNNCDYEMSFPDDDRLMGASQIKLLMPGNGGGDSTLQAETHVYWIASELGIPFNYARHVNLYVNGIQRNQAFVDSQQPNSDFMKQWYPDQSDGDLYKMVFWYEFDDAGLSFSSATAVSLGNFTTTGGAKKLARYRWNWLKRVVKDSANNYTNIFALVDTANTTLSGDAYTAAIESVIDVNEWARLFMIEKLVSNWDSYGNGGGQNMYGCKPAGGRWQMLIWDIDFAFGSDPASDMFAWSDSPLSRIFTHLPFQRIYYQAIQDAVNGPLVSSRGNTKLDARYSGLAANGVNPASPQGIKDFIAQRRTNLLARLAPVSCPFAVTINGGADFSTNRNLVVVSGTAPIGVDTILVNGMSYRPTWITLTNWTIRQALSAGTNALAIQGLDRQGTLVAGASNLININYTGAVESAESKLVIDEIMHHPSVPDASYVELYNTAVSNAFDLTGYRLNGLDFVFGPGSIIQPGGFAVVAKDRRAFSQAFGSSIQPVGEFSGNLDKGGETISLIKPGATEAQDVVIDHVTYDTVLPWPAGANGEGYSLQLIDPRQDHNRVANWYGSPSFVQAWRFVSVVGKLTGTNIMIWMDGPGEAYLDDISLVPQSGPLMGSNVLQNGDFESPLDAGWKFVGTNMTESATSTNAAFRGASSLHVVASSAGNQSKAIAQVVPTAATNATNRLTFWYRAGQRGTNIIVRSYPGAGLISSTPLQSGSSLARSTPGTNNSARSTLAPFPLVWLNEIQPVNTGGLADRQGGFDPWVELYNSGPTNFSLAGYFLSDDYASLGKWAFPSNTVIGAGQFLLVWLDGDAAASSETELHANFRPSSMVGSLAFAGTVNGQLAVFDYLNYDLPVTGRSYGSYPDGNPFKRRTFFYVTPGGTNNPALAPITVFVNEWMADNGSTLADPADGVYDDWFELYNATTNAADLSGYYLTDDLSNPAQFQIPKGYTIPPLGHLLVWADNEADQNDPSRADLHVNFKLSKSGECIGLFAPDGLRIDAVAFGPQSTDISQGRFPDGASDVVLMTNATPRAPNCVPAANAPPVIAPIPDQVVTEQSLLLFTVAAVDTNVPAQALTYSLESGAPEGATLDPATGLFAWQARGPATNAITVRVTDDGTPPMSATAAFLVLTIPYPRLAGVAMVGGTVNLMLPTYPGKIYQVQYTENLSGGGWNNLGAPVTADGASLIVPDSLHAAPQRFYRVIQLN